MIAPPKFFLRRQYTIQRLFRNAPDARMDTSRAQTKPAPSRSKSEITAIFLAQLIAANRHIRYGGIAVGDSPSPINSPIN
jgi:hypothetical protein